VQLCCPLHCHSLLLLLLLALALSTTSFNTYSLEETFKHLYLTQYLSQHPSLLLPSTLQPLTSLETSLCREMSGMAGGRLELQALPLLLLRIYFKTPWIGV
jgi:hypothetical protein